jgi:hypothetical protein
MNPDSFVIPAKAGTHVSARTLFLALFCKQQRIADPWPPAFAGVTT